MRLIHLVAGNFYFILILYVQEKPNNENILQVAYCMWLSVFTARTSKQSLIPSITPYSHLVVHQVCMLLRNVPEAISRTVTIRRGRLGAAD